MTPNQTSPFSLEGGRVGDGGEGGSGLSSAVAKSASGSAPSVAPPSPALPPRGGKGGDIARARRLRREQTLAEKALWAALRELNDNWRRQVPIGPYVADFAHHRSRLIIEVDGYYHSLPETIERDAVRTTWLTAAGYRVVRFAEKTVRDNLYTVIDQIRALAPTPNASPFCPAQMGV